MNSLITVVQFVGVTIVLAEIYIENDPHRKLSRPIVVSLNSLLYNCFVFNFSVRVSSNFRENATIKTVIKQIVFDGVD